MEFKPNSTLQNQLVNGSEINSNRWTKTDYGRHQDPPLVVRLHASQPRRQAKKWCGIRAWCHTFKGVTIFCGILFLFLFLSLFLLCTCFSSTIFHWNITMLHYEKKRGFHHHVFACLRGWEACNLMASGESWCLPRLIFVHSFEFISELLFTSRFWVTLKFHFLIWYQSLSSHPLLGCYRTILTYKFHTRVE